MGVAKSSVVASTGMEPMTLRGWTAPLCLRLCQYQGSYINVGDVIKMDIWNFLLIRHVMVQAIKRITSNEVLILTSQICGAGFICFIFK